MYFITWAAAQAPGQCSRPEQIQGRLGDLDIALFVPRLLPVTAGNLVRRLLVAAVYWFIYRRGAERPQ
jgi:formate/nitrite transporter FocA (FNT family)